MALVQIFAVFFAVCEAGLLRNADTGQAQALAGSVLTGVAELEHCLSSTDLHVPLSIDAVLESASLNERGFKPVCLVHLPIHSTL